MTGIEDQCCQWIFWGDYWEVPFGAVTWSKSVAVEPLDGIFNAILVKSDQVCGHLLGNGEMELGGPHDNVEGFKIKPFLRDIWDSNCSHLPIVDSLEESREIVTNIFK